MHDKVEFEVLPTCHTPDFDVWHDLLKEAKVSNQEIEQLEEGLKIINRNAFNRFHDDLYTIEKLDVKLNELQERILNSFPLAKDDFLEFKGLFYLAPGSALIVL